MTERKAGEEDGVQGNSKRIRCAFHGKSLALSDTLRQIEKEAVTVSPEVCDPGIKKPRDDAQGKCQCGEPVDCAGQIQFGKSQFGKSLGHRRMVNRVVLMAKGVGANIRCAFYGEGEVGDAADGVR